MASLEKIDPFSLYDYFGSKWKLLWPLWLLWLYSCYILYASMPKPFGVAGGSPWTGYCIRGFLPVYVMTLLIL